MKGSTILFLIVLFTMAAGTVYLGDKAYKKMQEEAAEVKEISQDARNMAMLCHLLGLFTLFVAPLIIWLLEKDKDPFIDNQGKEALNFQISVAIALFAGGLLWPVCIGIPILIVVPILDLIFCVIASVKSSGGQAYRYPLSLRLVK